MKDSFVIILFLFSASFIFAQGGAQINAGLTSVINSNSKITNAGEFHSGYTIGIQSRLKDGTFVAGPGLRYTKLSMMSSNNAAFFNKEENYHILTMPLNVGLEYRLNYIFKLRMYTGVDLNYFWKIDDNSREINFDYVKDFYFGSHAGIGIDIYWVTFDISYEYGLSDAHAYKDSKYNYLTFKTGFFF